MAALALAFAACYPHPVDPIGLPPVPTGFTRLPYVQEVSDSAAWILWMPEHGATDSVWFRVPSVDSAWTVAHVEDHGDGTRQARLGPLPPVTDVEYRVTSSGTTYGPTVFKTAPPAGEAATEAVRVLLFGDSGWGGAGQLELSRQMTGRPFDLAIHVGDIAYENGSEEDFTLRHFHVYSGVLDAVPFYPAVGNHDVRADGGRSYDAAFRWPAPFPGVRYYAFRWGDILFVSLDTSSRTEDVDDLRRGKGRQYEWLTRTLQKASSDSTVSWIVTFMHHPAYSHAIGISGHQPDRGIRRALVPLFETYGVDLVASGHDHHYERTWPVAGGKRVEPGCGPVYLVTGGGGASRYARDVRTSPLSAYARRVYEFVELQFTQDRIRGRVVDRRGTVIDDFTVRPFSGARNGSLGRCAR